MPRTEERNANGGSMGATYMLVAVLCGWCGNEVRPWLFPRPKPSPDPWSERIAIAVGGGLLGGVLVALIFSKALLAVAIGGLIGGFVAGSYYNDSMAGKKA
jgi:hypothetical protein